MQRRWRETGTNQHGFQSSPVPEDGCNQRLVRPLRQFRKFQSSPVPEDGCNAPNGCWNLMVSRVSILTRPGGRVQLGLVARCCTEIRFQSSPVPEDGCNRMWQSEGAAVVSFNPHPSRRTGATNAIACPSLHECLVSILTRPGGRVQLPGQKRVGGRPSFQSSPVPEDGCNSRWSERSRALSAFQSSPVPEDGCNGCR